MNDIKIPSIEFVRLKKGMTDSELNDYIAENDDYSFLVYLRYKYDFEEEWTYSTECAEWNACEDCVSWLNDWYEGQQNVEYLAISKLEEETCTNESEYNLVDGFECSNCGIIIENYNEIEIDEDYPEDRCMKEYAPRYCPNCGRKIVD